MTVTFTLALVIVATVLFFIAVCQSRGKSTTAWAFFLMALAYCWPIVR